MERLKQTVISAACLAAAALLCAPSIWGQDDAERTRRIIEAAMRSSSGGVGSPVGQEPEHPVTAVPVTRTEKPSRDGRRDETRTPAGDASVDGAPSPSSVPTNVPSPRIDTVYLSDLYTTHVIFSSDITYADLSNQRDIAGRLVEQSKNKLALKAKNPFTGTASVSVEETGGAFHTYILRYAEVPPSLVVDTRPGADPEALSHMDTVWLSTLYTTHIIFSSDVIYADVSQPSLVAGKLVDQGKNKLAAKARCRFGGSASLSVEEANGVFHTYLLMNDEEPSELVKDTRTESRPVKGSLAGQTSRGTGSGSYVRGAAAVRDGSSSSAYRSSDAPTLEDIHGMAQGLFHLSVREYDVRLTCENIWSYSDMVFMTFRLDNFSGISYEVSDANFVVESSNGTKRKVEITPEVLMPKNRFGGLSAVAGGSSRITYSFDKLTLASDRILKVYLYESGGQRNLELPVSYRDVNDAANPLASRYRR